MTHRFASIAGLAGLAWVAWGAFEASSTTVYGDDFASTLDYANMALFDAALVFTALAVLGIAAAHNDALGRVGRAAARGLSVGGIWLAVFATLDAAYPDTTVLEALATAGMVTFWIAGTIFGVTIMRARVFARWIGPCFTLAMLTFPPLSEIGGSIALGAVLLAIWAIERESTSAGRAPAKATL